MRVAHFFAGGGGGILASEILGHESVLAVEIDKRRCKILEQRKSEGWFPSLKVECCDIRKFNAEPWTGRVDCIAAGFPCQDISSAGSGAGIHGKRSGLIFDLFDKAIDIIQPSIIFLENVPAIRTRGRDIVIRELVARRYSWRDGTLAASHVGAVHRRNRWWCLAANDKGKRLLEQEQAYFTASFADTMCMRQQTQRRKKINATTKKATYKHSDIHTANDKIRWNQFVDRLKNEVGRGSLSERDAKTIAATALFTGNIEWLLCNASVCRMDDGLADRVDRIATCGDGQVPLQAAVAWILLGWHFGGITQ